MIGSGIFIVSADIARNVGSAGWLIAVWLISGFITLSAALSYGELSSMFPKAGGQYVYLREAFGKLFGFLYGWAFFAVIQTGLIAAVAVAFAKYVGYFIPAFGETNILLEIGGFTISAAQVLGIASLALLTLINSRGVENGKWIQLLFTFAKVAAIVVLIVFGLFLYGDNSAWSANWDTAWMAEKLSFSDSVITSESLTGMALAAGVGVAMVGALFSSDAWNNVTFIAGEIKKPERNVGLSLFVGTLVVTILYVSINLMYLNTLTITEIANAPADRIAVAAAEKIFSGMGAGIIAGLIIVSTFGCNNGLIMSGARVYYTMANDGFFLPSAGKLNKQGVPGRALLMQFIWASILCLSGTYGQLLDYIVFTSLLFYILTIYGIFKLRKTQPDTPRPYKAFGYPIIPALYIILASIICITLFIDENKIINVGAGLLIVLTGVPIYYYLKKKGYKTT